MLVNLKDKQIHARCKKILMLLVVLCFPYIHSCYSQDMLTAFFRVKQKTLEDQGSGNKGF